MSSMEPVVNREAIKGGVVQTRRASREVNEVSDGAEDGSIVRAGRDRDAS